MHDFHGNRFNESQGWGIGLQIQSYIGFYMSKSTIIVVILKHIHISFFLLSDILSSNLHIHEFQ